MKAEQLLAHFDRISDAPDALPQLRAFIIDLAVRGKLVEQDSSDESAAELLKRIEAEKGRLSKRGKLEPPETLATADQTELPAALPPGWTVTRLGSIALKLGAGSTPLGGKTVYQTEGVPFLRSQNVHNAGLRLDDIALIPRAIHDRMSGTHVQRNDILLNITGASIGRCALVPETFVEGNVSQHVAIVRLYTPEIREFVHLSLISPFYQRLIDNVQVGVSREGLSMQRLRLFPMLLPPLTEQRRIVAKVDELMALCDQLEAAQAERESWRDRLAASSLARLNNGADGGAFLEHARFHLRHLPRLTTRPEQIKQLRQTILNLAFRGRIVPQDANDGTGRDTLHQIEAFRADDSKPGQTSKRKKPILDQLNCPGVFEVPSEWAWSYLSFICEQIADVDHNMPKAVPIGVPFISAKDLKDDGTIDFSNPKMISEEDFQRLSRKVQIRRDDIVYSRIGCETWKSAAGRNRHSFSDFLLVLSRPTTTCLR